MAVAVAVARDGTEGCLDFSKEDDDKSELRECECERGDGWRGPTQGIRRKAPGQTQRGWALVGVVAGTRHTQTRTPVASIRGSEDGDLCDARNKGRLFGSRDSCQERGPGLDPF